MSTANYFAPPEKDSGFTKNTEIMKKDLFKSTIERSVTLDGLMTFGRLENGLRTADFSCCEHAVMEPFVGHFKVQGMRDGDLHLVELKKRVRNKAIFRDDNATLSKGQDGRFYFFFSLPAERLGELPEQLIRQAHAIAQKVLARLMKGKGLVGKE